MYGRFTTKRIASVKRRKKWEMLAMPKVSSSWLFIHNLKFHSTSDEFFFIRLHLISWITILVASCACEIVNLSLFVFVNGEVTTGRSKNWKLTKPLYMLTKKKLFQSWNWIFIRQIEIYDTRAMWVTQEITFSYMCLACFHQFSQRNVFRCYFCFCWFHITVN